MAKYYLDLGVDINKTTFGNKTLFHVACEQTTDVEFIKWLLRKGSDINLVDQNAWSGFHFACFYGNLKIVKFLVQIGVDINQITLNGAKTGLHVSCCMRSLRNLDIIQYLPQKGYDVNLPDGNGKTALEILLGVLCGYADESKRNTVCLCILSLIEDGAHIPQGIPIELLLAIKNRVFEITFMKDHIFQKFNTPVAQTITDFTMLPIKNTSLQNLLNILFDHINV